jgi:hypothetical protein
MVLYYIKSNLNRLWNFWLKKKRRRRRWTTAIVFWILNKKCNNESYISTSPIFFWGGGRLFSLSLSSMKRGRYAAADEIQSNLLLMGNCVDKRSPLFAELCRCDTIPVPEKTWRIFVFFRDWEFSTFTFLCVSSMCIDLYKVSLEL